MDDLTAAADLTDAVQDALGEATWLIVVCSPTAANSEWVGREIDLFRRSGGERHILSALYRGDPDIAFPPALRRTSFDGRNLQPLAADYRHEGDGPRLALLYDANGRVTSQQQGTANAAGTVFTALATQGYGYDAAGRVTSATVSGTTTASTTSYGYDAADRPLTTTVLMSGQGADRTTTNAYDGNGLLSTVTTATGTAAASTIGYTYTSNSQLRTIQDGKLNTTTYAYDGFDRLNSTTFADGTHEQLTYDGNSNVLTHALRDNATTI